MEHVHLGGEVGRELLVFFLFNSLEVPLLHKSFLDQVVVVQTLHFFVLESAYERFFLGLEVVESVLLFFNKGL